MQACEAKIRAQVIDCEDGCPPDMVLPVECDNLTDQEMEDIMDRIIEDADWDSSYQEGTDE